jgi:carboxypeptidase Q
MRKTQRLFTLLLLLSSLGFPQGPAERISSAALKPSSLESNLEQLTDGVGGRISGTPELQKAAAWGVAAFKAAGADSVHIENFTIPASWAEGGTEVTVTALLSKGVNPSSSYVPGETFKVQAVSLAWAPALPLHRRVRIVDIGEGTDEDFSRAGDISGAIALVNSSEMKSLDDLFGEYMKSLSVAKRGERAKVLALAFQSTRPHELLYRHINSQTGRIDHLPMLLVAREDAGRMARLLESGQQLYADVAIPNRIGGPVQSQNVVAELKGREKPDEFVVLGAHLDSWELGTGALDNGCNAALVIDALRAIQASGLRPRRSIRFILFSGEEQGLLGSHAYVGAHRGELDKAAGMVVFDEGSGRVTGFSLGGRKDIIPAATALADPLKQFDAATFTTDGVYGTDHFDFLLQGVPTFLANQEIANYLINYHAQSDTYDKVDFAQLKKNVAVAAAFTFAIADSPERVGARLNHPQIDQTLHESQLDEQMKGFEVWPDWAEGKRGR